MNMKEFRTRLMLTSDKTGRSLSKNSREIGKSSKYLSRIINGKQDMKMSDFLAFCDDAEMKERDFFDDRMPPEMLRFVLELEQLGEQDRTAFMKIAVLLIGSIKRNDLQ